MAIENESESESKEPEPKPEPGPSCLSSLTSVRLPNLKLSSLKFNGKEYQLELDSYADTCVLGDGALIFFDYDRPIKVLGYDESLGSKTYRTVSGALAYTHPDNGQIYHLVIHQAILIPHLGHHLLNPFQT